MEKPNPIPRCHAQNRLKDSLKGSRFEPCLRPAIGELVYDKPGAKNDISWPYCEQHMPQFAPLSKDLWIDLYEE